MGAALANGALGSLFAWSVLAGPVGRELRLGPTGTGAIFAGAVVVFTAGVLVAGPVADRRGARLLFVLAAAAGTGGLALAASVPRPATVVLGVSGGFGAANGMGYAAALHVAGTLGATRRGRAIGVVLGAYAAGGIVAAPVLTAAVEGWGWRPAVGGLAGVVGLSLAVAGTLVPRSPPQPTRAGEPPRRVRAREVALLWVAFGFCSAPTLFAFAHAAEAALARGVSLPAAAGAVAVLSAGNLAGRLSAGWAADRFGAVDSLVAAALATVAAFTLLAGFPAAGVVRPAFFLAGTTYGAVSTLVPAATAGIVGPERLAGAYGKVFSAWGLAGLTAPVAGGWLVEAADRYEAAFLAGAVAAAVGGAAAVGLRRR